MINRLPANRSTGGGGRQKSGFVYRPRTAESLKERAEQTGGRFDSPFKQGIDTFRPKVGDNLIRILPPTWDNFEHYGYEIWVHRYIGADNSTYLCPQKMLNKSCPICAAAKEAKDAGEQDEAKALNVAKLVVTWIIDRDEEQPTPTLYPMSWTMDKDIANLCYNKRTGKILLIDHPEEGYDVTIKRTGQGIKTRYSGLAIDRDPSPIEDSEKVQAGILDYIQDNPIPSTLHFYDADYLDKVLSGAVDTRDKDELDEGTDRRSRRGGSGEEEAAPRGRRGEEEDERPPRRRAAADDPDPEEDPPPRRTSRRGDPEEEDQARDEENDGRVARRRSSRDPDPEPEDPDAGEDPAPRGRRGSAAEEDPDPEPRRSSRRGRDAEPDPEEDPDPPARRPAGRTGRTGRR